MNIEPGPPTALLKWSEIALVGLWVHTGGSNFSLMWMSLPRHGSQEEQLRFAFLFSPWVVLGKGRTSHASFKKDAGLADRLHRTESHVKGCMSSPWKPSSKSRQEMPCLPCVSSHTRKMPVSFIFLLLYFNQMLSLAQNASLLKTPRCLRRDYSEDWHSTLHGLHPDDL